MFRFFFAIFTDVHSTSLSILSEIPEVIPTLTLLQNLTNTHSEIFFRDWRKDFFRSFTKKCVLKYCTECFMNSLMIFFWRIFFSEIRPGIPSVKLAENSPEIYSRISKILPKVPAVIPPGFLSWRISEKFSEKKRRFSNNFARIPSEIKFRGCSRNFSRNSFQNSTGGIPTEIPWRIL